MTAGRGWIALALVVFASWKPLRVLFGAYLFGGATVLQLHAQAASLGLPSQVMSAFPYVATIVALVMMSLGGRRPSARQARSEPLLSRTAENIQLIWEGRVGHGQPQVTRPGVETECVKSSRSAGRPRSWRGAWPRRSPPDKLKVGFIYVGPVGDFGYSYQHNQGRLAVEKALGDKVETTFLENVPEADSERSIEQLARTGHKLIFTTSFGFMEPTVKVAKKYPNVLFEHATGYKRDKNLATYSAKFHEGRYVQGVIAGKMTKANIIGYVASFPIPEVVSGINAFMLGAQSVNPTSRSRSSGPTPGSTPARKPTPPRRCSTRAPTSSPSTPTARRRCSRPRRAASSPSARPPT